MSAETVIPNSTCILQKPPHSKDDILLDLMETFTPFPKFPTQDSQEHMKW